MRVIAPTGQGVISGVCVVTGSGCAGGSAPGAFSITFASGCTVDGKSIPPETVGKDVGPSNNHTANFNLRTLPSGSFTGQVLVLIQAIGNEAGVCGTQRSSAFASFDSLRDL